MAEAWKLGNLLCGGKVRFRKSYFGTRAGAVGTITKMEDGAPFPGELWNVYVKLDDPEMDEIKRDVVLLLIPFRNSELGNHPLEVLDGVGK